MAKKKMLIFSINNFTLDFTLHREVVLKCISFLEILKDSYDFYLLDYDLLGDTSHANEFYVVKGKDQVEVSDYREIIEKVIPIKGYIKLSLGQEIEKIRTGKSFETDYIHRFEISFDAIYSFNNFISPDVNKMALGKKLPYKVLKLFVLSNPQFHKFIVHQYAKFALLNNIFRDYPAKKLQFISDPLDFKLDNFTLLSPDIRDDQLHKLNNTVYCPIYQYHYFIYSKPVKRNKTLHFVIGNTLYNSKRIKIFERYLKDIYEENKDNSEYRWHLSGFAIDDEDNTFVDYRQFYTNVELARYTLILNTYAENIMSANKVSLMISRDCIPFICEGADEGSHFFSKELLKDLEVKDSDSMKEKLAKTNYESLNNKVQQEFSYYKNPDYYRQVCAEYF